MEKLTSMTNFVLEQDLEIPKRRTASEMIKYGLFLKQPLTLGMFVPCGLDGNVLEEAIGADFLSDHDMDKFLEYEESKERLLFHGWYIEERYVDYIVIGNKEIPASIEFSKNGIWVFDEHKVKTIEQLSFYSDKERIEILLTESVKKEIEL